MLWMHKATYDAIPAQYRKIINSQLHSMMNGYGQIQPYWRRVVVVG